jgi:hypothetical protein
MQKIETARMALTTISSTIEKYGNRKKAANRGEAGKPGREGSPDLSAKAEK